MNERIPLPEWMRGQSFRVSDARQHGLGEGRLRNPELRRPYRGVRIDDSAPAPPEPTASSETAAVVTHCLEFAPLLKPGQYFSHATAAALWDVPLPQYVIRDDRLHVTAIRPALAPRMAGVVGHHVEYSPTSICERYLFPVSDPIQTWISLASILSVDDLAAAGDHLVLEPAYPDGANQRPYAGIADLASAAQDFHGRGARRAIEASGLLRQGAESRPESLLRLLLVRARLPEPQLNREIHDEHGHFLGRADLVWPDFRVIAEYDGDQHRTSRTQYEHDAGRIDGFVEAEWRVVRVRRDGLFVHPLETVSRVTRALRGGGWKPPREIAVIDPREGKEGR